MRQRQRLLLLLLQLQHAAAVTCVASFSLTLNGKWQYECESECECNCNYMAKAHRQLPSCRQVASGKLLLAATATVAAALVTYLVANIHGHT